MKEEYSTPELVEFPPLTDVVGGSIDDESDIALKANIAPVDDMDILEKVSEMPVSSWVYKQDPDVPHIGPMAQDFYAAFGVGKGDKTIFNIDAQGVSLASIKALYKMLQEKDAQIAALEARLEALEQDNGE